MRGKIVVTVLAGLALYACSESQVAPTTTASHVPSSTMTEASTTTTATSSHPTTTVPSELPLGGPSLGEAPSPVADREALPYCGAEFVRGLGSPNPYENIELVAGASDCYHERAIAGLPSELILLMTTIEGDPILLIRRLMSDGREILFWDTTQDSFGAMAWLMIECDGYSGPDQTDGVCADEVVLHN